MSIYPDAPQQELLRVLAYAAVFVVVARGFCTKARIMPGEDDPRCFFSFIAGDIRDLAGDFHA